LEDSAHKTAVALHVLGTKNTCNPAKLAEWATASHVEKHTPVPRATPAATPALRFYGDARSLKNKILFVDNFRVKQLNRLAPPGNLWL
jgi:hypothetical protein